VKQASLALSEAIINPLTSRFLPLDGTVYRLRPMGTPQVFFQSVSVRNSSRISSNR
jgi:hypothetical protein